MNSRQLWVGVVLVLTAQAAAQEIASPAIELLQRRDRLAKDDVDGRMALGIWAEEQQLALAAGELYREVLALKPDHPQAYDRWVKIADTSELPAQTEQVDQLKAQFPGMKVHLTRHFIILFNTHESWARSRGSLLEKAHDVYYSTFRRVGFRPLPLTQRLVCVLYESHADYLQYARQTDRAEMGWSAGYYSTLTNRIVFFDDRDSPIFKEVVRKKDELQRTANELREQIALAQRQRKQSLVMSLREELEQVDKQLTWYRNRHEALAKLGNASKTVHEAVHQLVFNSQLQSPQVRYALWISEGLATNFETDNPAAPFGPMHPNDQRRWSLQTHLEKGGKLIALDEFVRILRVRADDNEQTALIYNQAWALFGFLFRYHREELKVYLDNAMLMPPGERTPEQLYEDFVKAFGPPRDMDAKFENFVARLR